MVVVPRSLLSSFPYWRTSKNGAVRSFLANDVPQIPLLGMAGLFATHCCNNSIYEAFFLGCTMLCVPVFGDQQPNATAIMDSGVGMQIASPFAPGITASVGYRLYHGGS